VLQGDPLSPFLFIVVVDLVLREALREDDGFVIANRISSRSLGCRLTCLGYADDIALTCCGPAAAQRALVRLAEESERVGLQINSNKTEVLHVGISATPPPIRMPDGQVIVECSEFTYLGVLVMDPEAAIESRKQKAWRASHQLRSIFTSCASDDVKLRLFRAAVEPILAYGLETVPATASREDELNAIHRQLLRNALNIHYPDIISTAELNARTKIPSLSSQLRRRRQALAGHCLRSLERGDGPPLAHLLLHQPREPLRRGHARRHALLETLIDDLRALDMTPREAARTDSRLFRQRVLAS
jgi:hypothetical protein